MGPSSRPYLHRSNSRHISWLNSQERSHKVGQLVLRMRLWKSLTGPSPEEQRIAQANSRSRDQPGTDSRNHPHHTMGNQISGQRQSNANSLVVHAPLQLHNRDSQQNSEQTKHHTHVEAMHTRGSGSECQRGETVEPSRAPQESESSTNQSASNKQNAEMEGPREKPNKKKRRRLFSSKEREEVFPSVKPNKVTKPPKEENARREKELPRSPQLIDVTNNTRLAVRRPSVSSETNVSEMKQRPSQHDLGESNAKVVEHQPWEIFLPQGSDDRAIASAVGTLFFLVKQHIANFYVNGDNKITEPAIAGLSMLHSPSPEFTLKEILSATPYQDVVLEHCLNYLLLSGISFDRPDRFSLLPTEFTALPRAIRESKAMGDRDPRGLLTLAHIIQYTNHSTGRKEAFSRYRVFSCFLWQNVAADEQYTVRRDATITAAAEVVSEAFQAWETSSCNVDLQLSNLKGLFRKAAELGLLLYRQPSVFHFSWAIGENRHRHRQQLQIAVSPRLFKVENELAQAIDPPQIMVDMEAALLRVILDTVPSTTVNNTAMTDTYISYSKEAVGAQDHVPTHSDAKIPGDGSKSGGAKTTVDENRTNFEDGRTKADEKNIRRRPVPQEQERTKSHNVIYARVPDVSEHTHDHIQNSIMQRDSRYSRAVELPAESTFARSSQETESQSWRNMPTNEPALIRRDSRARTFPQEERHLGTRDGQYR